jgi:hypothetical protein
VHPPTGHIVSSVPSREQVARHISLWNIELRSIRSGEVIADTADFRDFIHRGFQSDLEHIPVDFSSIAERVCAAHAEVLIRLSPEGLANLDDSLAGIQVASKNAEVTAEAFAGTDFTFDFVMMMQGDSFNLALVDQESSLSDVHASLHSILRNELLPSFRRIWIATSPVINRTGARGDFTTFYIEDAGEVILQVKSGYVFSPAVGATLHRKPKEWFPWETVTVGRDTNGKAVLQLAALQTDSQQQTHESIITKANQSAGTSYGTSDLSPFLA